MTGAPRREPPGAGAIRTFRLPAPSRATLANGLQLITARHGHLPLVTADLVLPAGAAADPPGREGLARLTMRLFDTGTQRRSAEQVAWDLEFQGIELEAEAGWDAATIRMTVPRHRLEAALVLLAELVREPAFHEAEVARLREQQQAELLQRAQDPRLLASDHALRFIYAPGVPYGRPIAGSRESVASLDRDAVRGFHEQHFRADGAALILVGDVDPAVAAQLAGRCFADWTGAAPAAPSFDAVPRSSGTSIHVFDRPGSVQSEIRLGHVGVERAHADYFPILLMNEVLGGAFTSRLNMNLRERHGFTYGAHSAFTFRRLPGPFLIQAAVATDVTARAIAETLRELRALRDDGSMEDEVASARDFLRGVQPLQFQTTEQIATRLTELVVYDLADDFFRDYTAAIGAVRLEDVNRVARAHLHPDRLAIVVVGEADKVVDELRALDVGPVEIHRNEAD